MSKQEVTLSRIYNNKVRVLYYFYLTLFCRKSRPIFGGRRAIPIACGGRSTIGIVVAFCLVHSVLGPRARDKVISVSYVDNRVMVVRLQGKKVDLVIVQIYIPHSGVVDEEVEETYDKIEEIVEKEKKGVCVILMGDWNAVVGEDGRTVGRYGLEKSNEKGESLVNFCKINAMVIGNTMFEQHKRRRYMWISPMDSKRYQIHYIY